jgi:hypothetical protein
MFKKSAIALAIAATATLSMNAMASTESAAGDQYVEKVNEFIDGATLSVVAVTDTRYRQGKNRWTDSADAEMGQELNYTAYNVIVGFQSGYASDTIGVNLGGFFSGDMYSDGGQNEISQGTGWGQAEDSNGSFKMTTAAIKLKGGDSFTAEVGMIQGGVGTIGNVWSFAPGTYRGAKGNYAFGGWNLGYMATDYFTAPWQMIEQDSPYNEETPFDFMQSVGLSGSVGGLGMNFGLGLTNLAGEYKASNSYSDSDNVSFNIALNYALDNGMALGYQTYGVSAVEFAEAGDDTGLGQHSGLTFKMPLGAVTWDSQIRYTSTANGKEFAPRAVQAYGTNNGVWGQWWDALSDWNQDDQVAWSNRASFSFADGWSAYAGVILANGSNGERTDINHFDSEMAVNGTIGYSIPRGAMKGSTIRFHATYLTRDLKSGNDYNRNDFRLQLIVPYNFL